MPCYNTQIVFATDYRIGNLFRFKDKFSSSLRSKIVYLFICSRCNSTYVNATKRHQKVRFSEQIGISPRTGKALKPTLVNASKVQEQILMNQHTGTLDDFTILAMGSDNELLEIKESIMIKTLKPTLIKHQMIIKHQRNCFCLIES